MSSKSVKYDVTVPTTPATLASLLPSPYNDGRAFGFTGWLFAPPANTQNITVAGDIGSGTMIPDMWDEYVNIDLTTIFVSTSSGVQKLYISGVH